ncbi:MAG: hypothetical protein IJF28_00710 [Firmicutes bacterium]|nr:hypothetical protein [Bacillota bacterium]
MRYLLSWANENDIRVSYDEFNNVIMSSKATEGYENTETNIFQCTVDLENPETSAIAMSVASYIIQKTDNHGFIRVLFTTPENAGKLSRTYLTADNFISLDWFSKNSLLVGSAGTDYYTATRRLKFEQTSYTDAYQIVIEGLPEVSFKDSGNCPNPITIIGDILANAKSSGILLELASLNGGSSSDTYPTNFSCTILVNQKDANNMKKRVNAAMDNFYEKYNVDPETFTFTYSEVEAPEWVISYEDTARIISFIYTCPDGDYLKDDSGEVIAKANLGSFHTDNIGFTAKIATASKNSDVLSEMETVFETVCGLSEISYSKESGDPVWESMIPEDDNYYSESDILEDEEMAQYNSLVQSLITASSEITGKTPDIDRTLDYTPCTDVAKRVTKMNIVGFGLSEDRILESTEILIRYLENGIVE